MANKETMTGVAYDGLFGGAEVEVLTRNVTVVSGQKVKRGTLLSESSGKYSAVAARRSLWRRRISTQVRRIPSERRTLRGISTVRSSLRHREIPWAHTKRNCAAWGFSLRR